MTRFISCTLICLLTASFGFAQKKDTPKKYDNPNVTITGEHREIGNPLPPVNLLLQTGDYFTDENLEKDKPILLMMFNPTCGHCEDQTDSMIAHRDELKNFQVIMVISDKMPDDQVKRFIRIHNLGLAPEFVLGIDKSHIIDNAFKFQGLPQINIYDKNKTLKKIFVHMTPIDSLRTALTDETPQESLPPNATK